MIYFNASKFFKIKFLSNYKIHFKIIILLIFLQNCSKTENIEIRLPAIELYQTAVIASENKFYQEALESYEVLINEYSGTRLGTISHLMMADIYFKQSKWVESESSYRSFLINNPRSNLTPYVLNRLIALNYERNHYGLFIKSRDYDRNMEPNRKIIREYQRFYLLFPQSPYLNEVKQYYISAMTDLAEHELHVADFYFDIGAYHSSVNRYLYLLKNFPNFTRKNLVVEKLIEAYRLNQQPDHAERMQRIFDSVTKRKLFLQVNRVE